jgi:hypothetical protein
MRARRVCVCIRRHRALGLSLRTLRNGREGEREDGPEAVTHYYMTGWALLFHDAYHHTLQGTQG